MARLLLLAVMLIAAPRPEAPGQSERPRPPVIDIHVHSTNTSPKEQLERMKALNIRYVWVAALPADLPTWTAALPPRSVSSSAHVAMCERPSALRGASVLGGNLGLSGYRLAAR
jgi:hypothetical protein